MHNEKINYAYLSSDTDCCTRQCCGPGRPFEMKILDNMQREVIHLSRPLRCQCCCFPCCLQEIEVQSPPGTVVGYVEQKWALFTEILSLIPKAKMDIYFKCVVLENISPPPMWGTFVLEPQSNLEFSFQGVNVGTPSPHTLESPLFLLLIGYPWKTISSKILLHCTSVQNQDAQYAKSTLKNRVNGIVHYKKLHVGVELQKVARLSCDSAQTLCNA